MAFTIATTNPASHITMPLSAIAIEATTNKLTNNGSKKKDKPKPREPTKRPIAIPTIGKRYMYFAIFSKVAFEEGNIVKICDLGWTIQTDFQEQRNTFCGTYEYMAPEMIQ